MQSTPRTGQASAASEPRAEQRAQCEAPQSMVLLMRIRQWAADHVVVAMPLQGTNVACAHARARTFQHGY
jgi:RecB family exonuclease